MIGWLDASSGASGDMLLGAVGAAGTPIEVMQQAVTAVASEPVKLRLEAVHRAGFAATRCHVEVADSTTSRTWREIRGLLDVLEEPVRRRAKAAFSRLADAEAVVHGCAPEDVHFHEVGALDAIADVVGVSAGLAHLDLDELVVSPVALGGGRVQTAHGWLPVPAPAVAELLRGVPSYGGPVDLELCTPTGAALLVANASGFGAQPEMSVAATGIGAGARDPVGQANVLRLFVGEATGTTRLDQTSGEALVIETNVDDLDPRLWPEVIAALLAVGAADAWLSPILMKKGRPAHTLHVLVGTDRAEVVRREIFRQTSTIGVREHIFAKHALDREVRRVQVEGHDIEVKVASLDGEVLNLQPEYDQVSAVARA
ncbi:MAG: nickel pincer cofactor biosynthesis protein LarC, partial [Actinomycetota bacterium]|nr:nickel pincer cofactor biosynthesis protein LarC [Actinomycetota bacterium]